MNRAKEIDIGKSPFVEIYLFCTLHSIYLNIGFWRAVLYGNVAFSMVVLFLKAVFVFQKTSFKVKVLKTFKVSSDYHIKIRQSLRQRAILKTPSTVF